MDGLLGALRQILILDPSGTRYIVCICNIRSFLPAACCPCLFVTRQARNLNQSFVHKPSRHGPANVITHSTRADTTNRCSCCRQHIYKEKRTARRRAFAGNDKKKKNTSRADPGLACVFHKPVPVNIRLGFSVSNG